MSSIYDNWERLVAATLRREHDCELALCESFSSRASDISFDSFCEDVAAAPCNISIPSCSGSNNFKSQPTSRAVSEVLSYSKPKCFSFKELKNATKKFRPDSLLAEGASGYVFKGWINEHNLTAAKPGSGLVIAVKMLKPEEFEGNMEWLHGNDLETGVNYLWKLHHPNIVKVIGYCNEGDKRLLVYEFMSKGSLENHLFRRGLQPLSWATRIKVAIGAATGLSFLHEAEDQVIYRNFKASNILLDREFNAKLSDVGLAKLAPTGDRTHVLTRIVDTRGYTAPEYVATGRLTAKSNVYSFGVVLLELLSGRRVFDRRKVRVEQNLFEWAKLFMSDRRKWFRIMDTKLEGQYPPRQAYTIATLAWQCVSSNPEQRPHMKEVVGALEKVQNEN